MKALKKALIALFGAVMGCLFFVGCLSTKLSVTYMVDGETYRVEEYEIDAKVSLPTPPTKEGHTFIGWYTDEALTIPYAEGKVNSAFTLYAKFSVSNVYIVVNTAGGEKVEPIEVLPGGDYTIPEAKKEGHTFLGYTYIDENGDEQDFPLSGKYPSNVGIKITAKYEVNKYKVTFVGANSAEQEVAYGSVAVAPNAEKTGYKFEGWYTSATEQTDATKFDLATAIKGETTLYAKYTANQYKIAIAANGGAFANAADANVDVTFDGAYQLAEPTRTGYTFLGYTLQNGASFDKEGTYTVADNVYLSAQWQQNKYTVTFKDFDTDETITTVEDLVYGAKLPAIPTAQPGYEYAAAYEGDKTTALTATTIDDNKVVYVKYTAKTFTITVNGAQAGYENPTVKYGENYSLVAPDKGEGYDFVGFTMNGETFNAEGTYTWTDNIVITAVWNTENREINFYDGNTEFTSLVIVKKYNDDITGITLPGVPAKTGYETDGKWYTEGGEEYTANGVITEDIRLYAKYTAKNYKIYIEGYGPVSVTFNETYTLPALTNTGYILDGYLLDGKDFATTGTYTTADDITITPAWKADKVIVNFNSYGKTEAVDALRNCEVTPATPAEKTGYKFEGWYVDETKIDFATWKPMDDVTTLTAIYTVNTYTVTFKVWTKNGVVDTKVTVEYGKTLTPPAHAERDAYNFLGYTYNGTAFNYTEPFTLTEDITLEEKWELREDASLFEYNKDGNFFTERENYDADWTFVYLVGETYELGGANYQVDLVNTADSIYADVAGNILTAKLAGSFVVQVNNNGNIYTRTIKTVEYIKSMAIDGTTYDTAWGIKDGDYKRNSTDVWQKKVAVSAGEAMQVGKTNFIPEININGNKNAKFDTSSINVTVTVDGVETTDYVAANGAINFGDSLVGKKVQVTLKPKYDVGDHTLVYNVAVNNALNVYTNAEMKAAFANTNVKEINVLRNITAELDASQVDTFTWEGNTYTAPLNRYDRNNNDLGGTGVYTRSSGNLKVNGNYFTVDGSKLPLVDGRLVESYKIGRSGYTIKAKVLQNVHMSIFNFGKRETRSFDKYAIENLNIIGNTQLDASAEAGYQIEGKGVLMYSGGYLGIQAGSGSLTLNSVTSRMGAFALGVYGYDPMLTEDGTGYTHMVTVVANDCKFEKSWANNIYSAGFTSVTLNRCFVGTANGAAIHFDSEAPSQANGKDIDVDAELNLFDTDIQNWVVGTEAWFNAYKAASVVNEAKTTVEEYVQMGNQQAGTNRTAVKDNKINFVILMRSVGETSEWQNDNIGMGSVKVNMPVFDLVKLAGGDLSQFGNMGSQLIRFGKDGSELGFGWMEGFIGLVDAE